MGRLLTILGLLLAPCALAGPSITFDSGAGRIRLIELYTSEGCSSCPPADRWMSGLVDDPRLWHQFVPVAFHVDYWDAIGWPDRFASPVYSGRQRAYAREGAISTVYTPGLVLDGKEWRAWFRNRRLPNDASSPGGRLTVQTDGRALRAHFRESPERGGELTLHAAVLGFGMWTEVEDGENRGRRLVHDFVVLGYDRYRLDGNDTDHTMSAPLPETRFEADRKALAAWVTGTVNGAPLQAAGGWLPE